MKSLLILFLTSGLFPTSSLAQNAAEVLLETDREFARVTAEKGLEGWLSFFASDASIFPKGKPVIRGFDQIRRYYEETKFDPRILGWDPVAADISQSGDLGYTYGYWTVKPPGSEASETELKGKYTTIWKRQSDGSWKVVVDIGTE